MSPENRSNVSSIMSFVIFSQCSPLQTQLYRYVYVIYGRSAVNWIIKCRKCRSTYSCHSISFEFPIPEMLYTFSRFRSTLRGSDVDSVIKHLSGSYFHRIYTDFSIKNGDKLSSRKCRVRTFENVMEIWKCCFVRVFEVFYNFVLLCFLCRLRYKFVEYN